MYTGVWRFVIVAEVVGLLLGATSASVAGRPQPAATSGITEIVFLATSFTWSDSDPRQSWKIYFERAHPEIKVKITGDSTNTDENRSAVREMLTDDDPAADVDIPDVYLADVVWPAEFGKEGLALALDDLFPAEFWRRFDEGMVRAATYDGRIYAVPLYQELGLLYYRKDLLELAGLPVPRTWEELADQSLLLKSKGLVDYGFVWQGARFEGLTCNWLEFATDAGAHLLDQSGSRSRLDSVQSLEALRFMRSLITRGVSPQAVVDFRELQAAQIFESGRAAFLRAWNSQYIGLSTKDGPLVAGGFPIGVAELPTFAGRPAPGASTVGGWNLQVNPKVKHDRAKLQAVSAFIEWMTGVQGQYILAQYGEIPANTAVRKVDPRLQNHPVIVTVDRSNPVRRPADKPVYPKLSEAIYTEVHKALVGEVSPETALRKAHERINRVLGG